MQDFLDNLDAELQSMEPSADQKTQANSLENTPKESATKPRPKHNISVKPRGHADDRQGNNASKSQKPQGKNNNQSGDREIRGKFPSKFPDTKFFLPSLRDGYTRFMAIGGNNETGAKNMNMVQYGDDILIIDCGVQFTDATLPGVNYSIPDVSFLTKYKKNIKGMVITHAHLDHIGSLKHILPALGMPPIYATKLTLGFIKKQLDEAGLMQYTTLIEVDTAKKDLIQVGEFKVEFFPVNHSVPDCAGLYIETPGGAKLMHTGDFKIDHTPEIDAPFDESRLKEIADRGITLFMSDSTGSTRKGFSMSEKNV